MGKSRGCAVDELIIERLNFVCKVKFDNKQKNMASFFDMSPQSLNQYLKGKRTPGYKMLKKISNLGFDMNFFFRRGGEIKPLPTGLNELKKLARVKAITKELNKIIGA